MLIQLTVKLQGDAKKYFERLSDEEKAVLLQHVQGTDHVREAVHDTIEHYFEA